MISHLLKTVAGMFLKDTRVVLKPGPNAQAHYKIACLTVDPLETKTATISAGSGSFEATGTYGAFRPWSIVQPFSFAVWSILEQQFGVKDVQLSLSAPGLDEVLIMANNPTIGQPYVIIVDCTKFKADRFFMGENDELVWKDGTSKRNFVIRRNRDTANKEFEITVDPAI